VDERVLLVEDDPSIREMAGLGLGNAGFRVTSCADGREGLERLRRDPFDLAVLDVMLPSLDGFEITREIRKDSRIPIVMLTARADATDVIVGLELGADDYVSKPFSPREVVARIRAILRRGDRIAGGDGPLVMGRLEIDRDRREVRRDAAPLHLTRKEYDLLELLASHPGRTFTRVDLLEKVWDYAWDGDSSTVTVHIRRLREKIEDDPSEPRHLVTVWGVGYRFER
jgi:two-component system response regulator ResD